MWNSIILLYCPPSTHSDALLARAVENTKICDCCCMKWLSIDCGGGCCVVGGPVGGSMGLGGGPVPLGVPGGLGGPPLVGGPGRPAAL